MKAVLPTARAPIALFVYNRPWHAGRTVEALRRNEFAEESDLFVFSDGSKSSADRDAVASVREAARAFSGFRSLTLVERERNLGLAQSIITGVTELLGRRDRIIVLEDDMITSPHFLRFMNEALEFYKDDERVAGIHAYVYSVGEKLADTFFLRGADCWGWATWKRGWDLFEPDGRKLLGELRSRNLQREFDKNGAYPYTEMLEDQIDGKNDSWAVRWYASTFLRDRLCLHPGRSLVKNIGLDDSGTHCGPDDLYDVEAASEPVPVRQIPVEENAGALEAIGRYLKSRRSSRARGFLRRIAPVKRWLE
ncbi:MAG: glycosyltransferase family 2 protein [Deltaproteobacteria bacterium]